MSSSGFPAHTVKSILGSQLTWEPGDDVRAWAVTMLQRRYTRRCGGADSPLQICAISHAEENRWALVCATHIITLMGSMSQTCGIPQEDEAVVLRVNQW